METMDNYKKSDDVEADFWDLLYSFCRKWKQALAAALAGALLLGGYGYLKNRMVSQVPARQDLQEADLTKEESSNVAEAVRLKNEIDGLEEYVENSILMQTDAYRKERVVLLYCIDGASIQELPKIAECYSSFLMYGKAADAVKKHNRVFEDIKAVYLTELISVWEAAEAQKQVILENPQNFAAQKLLYIEVTGEDAGMAEQLAKALQSSMKEYARSVKKTCGVHNLTLLNDAYSTKIDSTLQSQQREKRELLKSQRINLNSLTSTLNAQQLQAYENETGIRSEDKSEIEKEAVSKNVSLKYIILGFSGGIFIYGCIFAAIYLLKGVVRSEREFKAYYRIPYYGRCVLKKTQPHSVKTEDDLKRIVGRIGLACRKRGIEKLCLLAEFTPSIQEKEMLASMTEKLQETKLELRDVSFKDISQYDLLEDNLAVIAVCKIGKTSYSMLNNAIEFYLENDIRMMGAVLLDCR